MASSNYNQALVNFKKNFSAFLSRIENKLNNLTVKVKQFNSSTLTLENNTVYVYVGSGLSSLNIRYPSGDFISTIIFSTVKSGSVNIIFPSGTKFVGSIPPKFYAAENWEISIHNGRVACAQLYDKG